MAIGLAILFTYLGLASAQAVRSVTAGITVIGELPREGGDGYYRLAVSPDGVYLAARDRDNKIDLFELDGARFRARFEGNLSWVTALAFSPDSKFLIALGEGPAGKTICWDVSTGRQQFVLEQGGDAMSLSPDGKLLRVATQEVIQAFEFPSGRPLKPQTWGDAEDVASAISGDGQFTVSHRKITNQIARTQLVDLENGSTIVFDGPADLARSVSISPDESWIAAVYHHSQKISWWYRLAPRDIHFEVSYHQKNLHSVNFSWDSRWVIATSWDGSCSVWEAATGQLVCVLNGHAGRVMSVVNDQHRDRILTSAVGPDDHRIIAWPIREIVLGQVKAGEYDSRAALELLSSPELSLALPALAKLLGDPEQHWIREAQNQLQLDANRDAQKGLAAVNQLNSPNYAERLAAMRYLSSQQDWVEQLLRNADRGSFSPEQKYRLEKILKNPKAIDDLKIEQLLFASRLVLLLEWRASSEAIQLLELIAHQHEDSRIMGQALGSLRRIETKKASK